MRKPRPPYQHQRSGGSVIYYRRTPLFWKAVLASVEPVVTNWPVGPNKKAAIEFFALAPEGDTDRYDDLVPADRHLSPTQVAEHLLVAFFSQKLGRGGSTEHAT